MSSSSDRRDELLHNFTAIKEQIQTASTSSSSSGKKDVLLVAVSKLKPASDIRDLYDASGHRHFGENYIQELIQKANDLPRDIEWHFIGGLQSNKCKLLASSVPNLYLVETVDSAKKANELNKGRLQLIEDGNGETGQHAESKEGGAREGGKQVDGTARGGEEGGGVGIGPLRVLIQVNTSGEESKSGVTPDEASGLANHIRDSCPALRLHGVMTIGALATSQTHSSDTTTSTNTKNQDFQTLVSVRDRLEEELGVRHTSDRGNDGGEGGHGLVLSMGMSEDFTDAIEMGTDEVRVGSKIFGARPPKQSHAVESQTAHAKS